MSAGKFWCFSKAQVAQWRREVADLREQMFRAAPSAQEVAYDERLATAKAKHRQYKYRGTKHV